MIASEHGAVGATAQFSKLMPMAKRFLDEMLAEQCCSLDEEVERHRAGSNPPDVQAMYGCSPSYSLVHYHFSRMAGKYLPTRIEQAAERWFREMGVVSVIVTCHKTSTGQIAVETYD